jgi:hypothetical protein
MRSYSPNDGKTPGFDTEPARIVLESGEEFDVVHHNRNKSDTWVFAYAEQRDGGIDYWFPASSIQYIDTSTDAFTNNGESEKSGGVHSRSTSKDSLVEVGDLVTVAGETGQWMVHAVDTESGKVTVENSSTTARTVELSEISVEEKHGVEA